MKHPRKIVLEAVASIAIIVLSVSAVYIRGLLQTWRESLEGEPWAA